MIRFEKVSKGQFILNGGADYDSITLPTRATAGSAGYDFYLTIPVLLKPGESVVVPTGIRCAMPKNVVLMLYPRSGLGFKYFMGLANTTGVIDSDYYNAVNEGHIMCKIVNNGESILQLNPGDRFVQGIFINYLTTDDDNTDGTRTGGFGSTDKAS